MSDFGRVDAWFGDTPFDPFEPGKFRQVRVDLGSAAVYWAAIDLYHANPPETLRTIPVEVKYDITVGHGRHIKGILRKKFEDVVMVTLGMGGEGMFDADALYDTEDVAEFKQLHDISPDSTLIYMGISPPRPDLVSSFLFNEHGELDVPKNMPYQRDRFTEVMNFLELHRIKVPE